MAIASADPTSEAMLSSLSLLSTRSLTTTYTELPIHAITSQSPPLSFYSTQSPLHAEAQEKLKTHSQPQNFLLTGSTGLLTFNLPPNSPFCPIPSPALMVSRYGHFSASATCATRAWMRCCGTDMKVRQDEWDSGTREGTWMVPCSRALSNLLQSV